MLLIISNKSKWKKLFFVIKWSSSKKKIFSNILNNLVEAILYFIFYLIIFKNRYTR